MTKLQAPFVEQHIRRQANLVTPVTFSVDLGGSATTFYTGIVGKFFLLREISVCNTTGGALSLTVVANGSTWVNGHSVAANTTESVAGLGGVLIADGEDLTGTGTGLTIFGWGLQIEGGDAWTL